MSSFSVASVVSRLSPLCVRTSHIPRFTTSPEAQEASWASYATSTPTSNLQDWLSERLGSGKPPRCIIFGEQHHQPGVLKAQLQLLHALASPPFGYRVTLLMEHFNLLQQPLLHSFAATGDPGPLQTEYAKSREGFRIHEGGYLPLLQLARELDNVNSEAIAGFPPRGWARTIMQQGKQGIIANEEIQKAGVLDGIENWQGLQVSNDHNAYIRSSISGNKPVLDLNARQGGLNAAQAFKDTVMAWKADQLIRSQDTTGEHKDILLVVCGSGHCEFDFGATERITACERDELLLLVCKPDDGAYWKEPDAGPSNIIGGPLADGIIVYEAVDDF